MISCALDPSASGAVPATFVIPVRVNYIGDRIGVRQVSHPSSGRSPTDGVRA